MYFDNPLGFIDTIIIGFDPRGTRQIDQEWNEINLLDRPFGEGLDVRISDAYPERMDQISFQSKINIYHSSCEELYFDLVSIEVYSEVWPVTARWDSSLFQEDCIQGSLFTSYDPGGWFDAGGYGSKLSIVKMAE